MPDLKRATAAAAAGRGATIFLPGCSPSSAPTAGALLACGRRRSRAHMTGCQIIVNHHRVAIIIIIIIIMESNKCAR
jgi:hypothetical protein